ncbi:MAG: glycosyltransferase family 4 protein [bacterium]
MNQTKIKIVHIITRLELGGAQQNTLYTAAHLDHQVFETALISGQGGFLDSELPREHIKTYFVAQLKRSVNPWCDLIALFKIYRILRKIKPDIVHTHSSKAGILGRWASYFAGIPVIIHTYHGFGFNEHQSAVIRYAYVFIERLTAYITTHIICVSHENVSYALSKKIGTKSMYTVIRSGIHIEEYTKKSIETMPLREEFRLDAQDRLITMVACFKKQKNCTDFIRVAHDIVFKSTSTHVKFVLIGDGIERIKIENEIKKHNLQSYFMLPGWRRDINAVLKISSIFVLTSLWEGLPRAIVEALVSGIPVVANGVDGVKEVVKNGINGYTCEPHNIIEMSNYIQKILADPQQYAVMSKNASASIKNEFDIHIMVNRQQDLYNSLLNNLKTS